MTPPTGRWLTATLAVGALALALSSCGGGETRSSKAATADSPRTTASAGSSGAAEPRGAKVTGRQLDLELDDPAEKALSRAGISWRGESPARKDGGDELRLPVTGGRISYDPLAGSVTTSGATVASKGGKETHLRDLVVDLDAKKIRGTLDGRRLTVATLDTSKREVEHAGGPVADVDGIDATFTKDALHALDRKLGTSLPGTGMTAELELHVTR